MTDTAISEAPVEPLAATRRRHDTNGERMAVAAPRSQARTKSDFAQYRARWWANIVPLTFGIVLCVVMSIGWLNRDEGGLTPESGIGYWLGIVGGSFMLLLLLYPLRKRVLSLTAIGSTALWFRIHMILGIVGPVLILFHANFKLGSVNSNVALAAMLIVATSGIIGRYLYSKIHLGLYGRKAQVREILADADALTRYIGDDLPVADHVVAQLNAFAQRGMTFPKGVLAGLLSLPVLGVRASMVRARLIGEVRQVISIEGKRLGWSRKVRRRRLAGVVELVTLHIATVKKAAVFAFYERLFGLWHVFHLPLFYLLVIAATIHVFAAHFF